MEVDESKILFWAPFVMIFPWLAVRADRLKLDEFHALKSLSI